MPPLQDSTRNHSKAYAYSVVSRRDDLEYAVRDQNWRYGKWPRGEELYDLGRDPHKRNNLAGDPKYSERLKELRTVLAEKQTTARSKREVE